LVGKDNVAGLNLSTLSGPFGLEPFVGAALAVASDVRWKSRNIGDAVQILLEVSGEDAATVGRKNRKAWKGKLGVRFMLMSNDTPTFSDRSGALVDRMIYVSFRQSFFGREDPALTDKLLAELPGIFNWALDGLERLTGRGRFTQPDSGVHEQEATRRLADPVGAFLEDWCTLSDDAEILLDHLYLKFRNWCESEGRDRDSTTKEIFSRDIRSKVEGLGSRRARENGKFVTYLKGIDCSAM
jgi:putative DNA primase/helicase